MSDQLKSLAARMVAVMGDVPTMIKNGRNVQQKYEYVTAEDVKAIVRPLLRKHGIAVFSEITDVQRETSINKNGTLVVSVLVKMRFTLACAETDETMACEWYGEANDYADKAVNKGSTAAEKYWLISTFLLSTSEPDADEETVERTAAPVQRLDVGPIPMRPPAMPVSERMPAEPAGRITKSQLGAIRELSKDVWGPTYKEEGAEHVRRVFACKVEELSDIEAERLIEGLKRKLETPVTP